MVKVSDGVFAVLLIENKREREREMVRGNQERF